MVKRIRLRIHKIYQSAHRNRGVLLMSLCNTIILLVLTYILNNQALFTGEDLRHFAWMEVAKNRWGIGEKEDMQDVLFVNTAYDKQLTEHYDDKGLPVGNIAVTDRSKLLRFLRVLHDKNQYEYIFLDVEFEKGCKVPTTDSLLFAEICQMRDIVVANFLDSKFEWSDSILVDTGKVGISQYEHTIISTNFVRYKYSYGDNPSMPLFAFQKIRKHMIKRHLGGLFYTCNGKLCYNSLFINFPVDDFEESDSRGYNTYYNLGSELLMDESNETIDARTKGKYIVIGDMIDDTADTYCGKKPCPVIIYDAFQALMKGKHYVKWWVMLFMAILYFLISFTQLSHKGFWEQMPFVRKSRSKTLRFGLSFIEYTLLLSASVTFLYIFTGESVSVLFPSIYFAIQKNVVNYKKSTI